MSGSPEKPDIHPTFPPKNPTSWLPDVTRNAQGFSQCSQCSELPAPLLATVLWARSGPAIPTRKGYAYLTGPPNCGCYKAAGGRAFAVARNIDAKGQLPSCLLRTRFIAM
jgi:hypothetical protein